MKKGTVIIIIVAAVALLVLWTISGYNSLVTERANVNAQWANVESQYQRRADLIPNLVATVRGYASHESETLENVIAARARATQVTVDASNLTPETLQQYQAAQGELTSALGRLLMITENYPDLKANQNFLELQSQLEGTENRIAVERQRYNEVAKKYDIIKQRFPKNLIASLFGFEDKPYFTAEESAAQAPRVEF